MSFTDSNCRLIVEVQKIFVALEVINFLKERGVNQAASQTLL
jgi:hypothetical protein